MTLNGESKNDPRASSGAKSMRTNAPGTHTAAARRPRDPIAPPVAIKTIVRPISNAIAILRYLGQRNSPDTTSRISKELGLNPSTCFNILRTLVSEGVIDFDQVAKTYRLGLGLAKLADNVLSSGGQVTLAKPSMNELAEKHSVTVALWRVVGTSRMVLAAVENSSRELRIHLQEGLRLPLLLGSAGRVLALEIGMGKADLRKEFKLLRWARPLSFERFWDDAAEAKQRGWATDDGYFSAGIRTIGAVVRNPKGEAAFVLVALMFRDQHNAGTINRIGNDVARLARKASDLLY